MGSTFNSQILVEKLTKLNNSQQSIETLSHWCIFHMNKAKLVVETWDHQFHNSPREQRLAFLYLANDILQNSRRKGAEFVAEFWRVLPEALRDVIHNGNEFGKNAALRLISIWDERKVFGSRGHILKEEFMGRQLENNVNRTEKQLNVKLGQSTHNRLDKIVSNFETIYGGELDEEALLSRCSNTNNSLEKVIKDIDGRINSGNFSGSEIPEDLQAQHATLRECIEHLRTLEASRSSLVSHLRDALLEQESKLDQVRNQLQAAQMRSNQVANISRGFVTSDSNMLLDEQGVKEAHVSLVPPVEKQANSVVYTRQVPLVDKPPPIDEESRKSAAAAVAAQLTNSSSSAEMLTHVLTSFVSGVGFGKNNSSKEPPSDPRHMDKRPKLDNEASSYTPPPPLPPQNQQTPPQLPCFPHTETRPPYVNTSTTRTSHQPIAEQPPPPSSPPPPPPPLPPVPPYAMAPQLIHTAESMSNAAYTYGGATHQPSHPLSTYPSVQVTSMSPYGVPPVNHYQPFPGSEGGYYGLPSSVPMVPISR